MSNAPDRLPAGVALQNTATPQVDYEHLKRVNAEAEQKRIAIAEEFAHLLGTQQVTSVKNVTAH
jgi:hypothetical protein